MIKVAHGTRRMTVVIPSLGVAVKLPKMRLEIIWKRCRQVRSMRELKKTLRDELRYWTLPASLFMNLFGGWLMNVQEAWFSLSHRSHKTILPTYFSFFGLANVMPAGQSHDVPRKKIWDTALLIVDGWGHLDPHTWGNPENFVRDKNGRLRLVDYADPRTRNMLCLHQAAFEEAFKEL